MPATARRLPADIQRSVDETDALHEEMRKATEQAQEAPAPAPQDVKFEEQENEVVESEAPAEGEPAEDDYPKAEDEAPPAEDENSGTYKQRWKSLQGSYRSQQQKNQQLQGRIETLERMVASVQHAQKAPEPEPEPEPQYEGITSKDVEDYGEDLIGLARRASGAERLQQEVADLRAALAAMKEEIGGVGQQQQTLSVDTMLQRMDAVMPDWRDMDTDPAFNEWLDQTDVFSGTKRRDLLNAAGNEFNADRVLTFFKAFNNEKAAVGKTVQNDPAPAPRKGRVKLETLASPGTGSSGTADATRGNSRTWRESEIGAFYEDARRGKYRGKDEQRAAIESEIQSALSEGRILVGQ